MFFSIRPHRIPYLAGLAGLLLAAGLTAPADAAKARHHAARAAAAHPALRGTGLPSALAARRATVARRVVKMPASPTDPDKDAALVIDSATGKVLYARNETLERHPASLTKMMTLYLLFEALKANKLNMQTQIPVSRHASQQKPTKLFLRPGQSIDVDTAIRAVVILSANDVAVTIAEMLGGTEGHFAEMMTDKAKKLGMKETNFHNASGLPDPLQITTATDLSALARHLAYDFPQYYSYFSLPGFTWQGRWIPTHDNLIGRYQGADGVKTGYTGASGFNLVSSVVRDGRHIVGVVMGGRTALRRDLEMVRILDEAFTQIAANPALVAAHAIPWHQFGGEPAPVVASLSVAPAAPSAATTAPQPFTPARSRNPFAGLTAMVSPAFGATARHEDDEDAAEKKVAADEDASILAPVAHPASAPMVAQAPAAMPAPNAVKPQPAKPAPAIRPRARPEYSLPVAMVARAAPPPPQPRPALRTAAAAAPVAEGDTDSSPAVPPAAPGRNWTIQIGAYADKALAQAQLSAYADKARDVLGQAAKIVTPAQSPDGHTIYRARFGLFAENEARDVCSRLTNRGQTCFAAIASTR